MKRKRTYKAESVEQVQLEAVLPLLAAGCIVALDVAKQKFLVALATLAGEVVKLFRFEHPTQTRQFLNVVDQLKTGLPAGQLKAAMEPTGTYGDAIRHQLTEAGVSVWMVEPKRTHDSRALFDNVASLHDAKSAVLVAKLATMGLASEWKAPLAVRRSLRALIELRAHESQQQERCFGRMEGVLARHWPEFGRWMDVREQKSALRLLSTYPNPSRVHAEADAVRAFLRNASRGQLSTELVEGVVSDAKTSLGLPMVPEEELQLSRMAKHALDAQESMESLEREMSRLAQHDEVFARLQPWMGTYTAAVIMTLCDPRQYAKARQLEKACGLNLREKSSGQHVGRLAITKRGPGLVRKVLYLFALRMIRESSAVHAWYTRRRGYTEDSKQRAVVAVMRKLVRAVFHVANGNAFDASKLFDLRRLNLESRPATVSNRAARRTTPRPIASRKKRVPAADAVHA